ncbi:hypothetical protein ACS0TY_023060 [Phlomoides rotata]
MAVKRTSLRVVMFPWLAHGHIFPFLELAKILSRKNFHIYLCSTPINLDSIKNNLQTDSSDLLIYDGFQPWSAKTASSLGIPSVHFSTSGSTAISFFHHTNTHKTSDTFPWPAIRLNEHETRDLVAASEHVTVEDLAEGFAFGVFRLSCDIILIKSCRGIEGKYMDHLSTLCNKKIVPTGPLITFAQDQENADSDIMKWLSEREEHSTLYISFGSENYFSREQIGGIAKGLEMSDVNFIWVARSPAGSEFVVEEALPEGFFDRV